MKKKEVEIENMDELDVQTTVNEDTIEELHDEDAKIENIEEVEPDANEDK